VAGLILAGAGWGVLQAAELAKEEQAMTEPQPGPEGPMQAGQLDMGPEQVERMLAQIRKTNPEKADELVGLREKDPEAFKAELRKFAREQFMKRMAERRGEPLKWQKGGAEGPMAGTPGAQPRMGRGQQFEGAGPGMTREWMQERSEEYAKWLKENFPDEATKIERLKEVNPGEYMRAMGISWKKYGRIYLASKDNPQLAPVLKEQLALKEKRTALLQKIKTTTDEKQKKALTGELEQVVGQQFDLIVKRKQIAYEDMAKKLEELKKEVDQRKAEVEKWKTKDFKNQQVKQRVNELINETEKFEWDN
jgi:hypothetical protein